MTKDTFLSLPDWHERCQAVCDLHGYGSFDQLSATRRAEVITIARNVVGAVLTPRPATCRHDRSTDQEVYVDNAKDQN